MKVSLGTLEFDDDQRTLLAAAHGKKGLATRELIRDEFVPKVIKAELAKLEAASINDEAGGDEEPAADEKPAKSKKDKKGKKDKTEEVVPEPAVEEKPAKKDKKAKKGKKNKG